MSCTICHHGWCWSCGFADDHWFHEAFEGGCQVINSCCFGFDGDDSDCDCSNIHWTLRFLMMFLGILLFIPILTIAIALAIGLFPLCAICSGFVSVCVVAGYLWKNYYRFLSIIMIPLYPVQLVLVIVLSIACFLIAVPLTLLGGILMILFYVLRILYQWCAPKKSN